MKALILLSLIVMSSCSTYTTLYSCGQPDTFESYEALVVADAGEGVMKQIALHSDQCARLYYEQANNGSDYIKVRQAGPKRK